VGLLVVVSELIDAVLLKSFNFILVLEHLVDRVQCLHHYKDDPVQPVGKNSEVHDFVSLNAPRI
jgi:hypothetical protein